MKITSGDNRTTAPHLHGDGHQLLKTEGRTSLLERCDEAREWQQVGDYESARSALSDWWPAASERPRVDGLDPLVAAELLLRAGALTGHLASAKQIKGAQANAKELIAESIRLFELEELGVKAAEARAELGWCYWREGNFKSAREVLRQALKAMGDGADGSKARAGALMYAAIVELHSGHPAKALDLLKESEPLFSPCDGDALKGRFNNNLGLVYKELGQETGREDFFDKAVIAYTAAGFYFSQAKAKRPFAHSENNLGFVLLLCGRFDEAAGRLERAHKYFVKLDDTGTAAQVKETQAQLHLAQGRCREAERAAAEAVRVLEAGERPAVLAEALTTRGVALARSGRFDESRKTLERAVGVAEEAGAWERAGLAALSALEELSDRLNFFEARKLYERACSLLAGAHHYGTLRRLSDAARRLIAATREWGPSDKTLNEYVAGGPALEAVLPRPPARRLSGSNSPLLVTGKNAEARRLLARMAHERSRRVGPLVVVDCAAVEDDDALPEFLGRDARRAARGTLFLDKVDELSRNNQAQLLRLVKDGVIEHGRSAPRRERIDVSVVTGTSADLSAEESRESFLPELYERLSSADPLNTPPAEVLEEMYVLAGCINKEAVARCCPVGVTQPEAAMVLRCHAAEVPGALARLLVRMSATADPKDEHLAARGEAVGTFSARIAQATDDREGPVSLAEILKRTEKLVIRNALIAAGGKTGEAAKLLHAKRQTLEHKIEKDPELMEFRTPIVGRRRRRAEEEASRKH